MRNRRQRMLVPVQDATAFSPRWLSSVISRARSDSEAPWIHRRQCVLHAWQIRQEHVPRGDLSRMQRPVHFKNLKGRRCPLVGRRLQNHFPPPPQLLRAEEPLHAHDRNGFDSV